MSVTAVVTGGYGSFGSVALVVTAGYLAGGQVVAAEVRPGLGGGGKIHRWRSQARSTGGQWVKVDQETPLQRERRIAAEREERYRAHRALVDAELERARSAPEPPREAPKPPATVHYRGVVAAEGGVFVSGGAVALRQEAHLAVVTTGLVEVTSGVVQLQFRSAVDNLRQDKADLDAQITQLQAELVRVKRNVEALEILLLAA